MTCQIAYNVSTVNGSDEAQSAGKGACLEGEAASVIKFIFGMLLNY